MQHMEIEYMEWLDIIEFTVLFTLKYLFINVLMEKGVIFLSYSCLPLIILLQKHQGISQILSSNIMPSNNKFTLSRYFNDTDMC